MYKITNNLNGTAYIGQTINPVEERFRTHCAEYSQGKCPKLWNAIQCYGKDNFSLETIWSNPGCTIEELDEKEKEFIQKYNTLSPNGYNLQEGGHGSRHNIESRIKISGAKKQLWAEKGGEIRKKVSEREVSEDIRKRMSDGCIRKYEERPELKEHSRHRLGQTPTPETRQKMVDAWKKRREKPGYNDMIAKANASKRKKVNMFDENRNFVDSFESVALLVKHDESFTKGGVESALRNGTLYLKRYYFSYTEEPPPPKEREYKPIYCFDKVGVLIDVCKSLEEVHKKTGFSASGVLSLAIKQGKLYKDQFYFSYSPLPPVSTA